MRTVRPRRAAFALGFASSTLASAPAVADDKPTPAAAAAAEEATTPLPSKEPQQLRLKTMYTFPHGATRYDAELRFEALLRYAGVLIPDLEVKGFWSVARVQITGESLENAGGTAGGLEDLNFADVAVSRIGPLALGAGFGTVFPLATSAELGDGKWQLGPALAMRIDPVPALHVAALGQALWSVAGSSQFPNLAYASVQPFVTAYLPAALFLSSDATAKFFWAGGRTTVPVNLGFGHAFSGHFVGTVKCQVTVAGSDRGAIQGEVDLNFQQ
jgi:hypothetical protein